MKKSKYRRLKSLSFILSVIMIICSIPMTVIAETADSTETTEDDSYVYDVMESEEIELEATEIAQITEVESLREENVKHFKLPDGTYEMIVYGEAVHRKDSDGKWQNIDNNLELTAVKNVNMFASSDMRTTFASSFGAGQPLMNLSENGYSVSMSLVSDNINSGVELMSISEPVAPAIQNAVIREKDAKFDTISQAAEIDNKSSIKYQNVKANTDIEYVMSGNDIKENIIIKAKGTNYIYKFDLALDGLVPELVNNTVILKDLESNETKYIIPEPYMYDADGNMSYAVAYTLTNRDNGVYRLTVTADSSWINAEERAFPVVVDPTITPMIIEDTYVNSGTPTTLYYASNYLNVSSTQSAFLRADLPFPADVLVNTAYLNISYYYNGSVTSGTTTIGAYRVQSEWHETNLTYNRANELNIGSMIDSITLSGSQGATSANPKLVSIDITDLADIWTLYDANYGIALKYISHVSNPTVTFVSSNSSSNRPSINVNYTYKIGNGVFAIENVGVEDKWMTVASEDSSYLTSTYSATSPLSLTNWDMTRLFKISKHSNMSSYIIRSMVNNCLSIQPEADESGKIYWKIVEIDPDDANVPASKTFHFSFDSTFGGYRITPYGDLGNMIGYVSTDGSIQGDSPVNSYATWNLTKYIGEDINHYSFSLENEWDTNGVAIGTEYKGTMSGRSTVINVNRFDWSISNTQGAITCSQDEVSREITFLPLNFIEFGISFNFYNGNSATPQIKITKGYVANTAGGFFIQNVATEMYMEVENYPDESIVQDKYSAASSQRWIFERVTEPSYLEGCLAIKSASSGEYLGVDVDDSTGLRLYDYINDFSVWNVNRSSDGTYTFTCNPTIPDGYVVSVQSQNSGVGTNIIQQREADMDSDECDEWYIVSKVISMVNYYSDSMQYATTLRDTIDDAISFANAVYARYFGISIYMDGNAQSFYDATGEQAIADSCPYDDSACDDSCDENIFNIPNYNHNHHKNMSLVFYQLYNRNREDDHIYVLWEDREPGIYCTIKDGVHIYEDFYAYVRPVEDLPGRTSPVINFIYIEDSDKLNVLAPVKTEIARACMIINLAHELAHTIGMPDVYDAENEEIPDNEKHDVIDGYVCIMEQFEVDLLSVTYYQNVLNGSAQPFCSSCMAQMRGLTSEYISGQRQIIGLTIPEEE